MAEELQKEEKKNGGIQLQEKLQDLRAVCLTRGLDIFKLDLEADIWEISSYKICISGEGRNFGNPRTTILGSPLTS